LEGSKWWEEFLDDAVFAGGSEGEHTSNMSLINKLLPRLSIRYNEA
jgi:hypothetical protein